MYLKSQHQTWNLIMNLNFDVETQNESFFSSNHYVVYSQFDPQKAHSSLKGNGHAPQRAYYF